MTDVKRRKRKKKTAGKLTKTITIILAVAIIFLVAGVAAFKGLSGAVSADETLLAFTVNEGDSYSDVGRNLKEQGFIKSNAMYKLYVKFISPDMLYAGDYALSKSMDLKEIITVIASGQTYSFDAFYVTFPEGKNIVQIARIIENNTINTQDEFFALLKDESYLDELIENYWFLTDEIKNPQIYYSLEGYLFPDTYQFSGENMPLKDIIEMMLDQTGVVLEKYKSDIQSSSFTIHQMLSLASVIELEAANSEVRADVAGVFYNRLADNWALGSCVTSYYGSRVEIGSRDLYMAELNDDNPYNTRNEDMTGLPVGPICCPSKSSISAAITPAKNDYYFFCSDVDNNTYFTRTYEEHIAKVEELEEAGTWLTYE